MTLSTLMHPLQKEQFNKEIIDALAEGGVTNRDVAALDIGPFDGSGTEIQIRCHDPINYDCSDIVYQWFCSSEDDAWQVLDELGIEPL